MVIKICVGYECVNIQILFVIISAFIYICVYCYEYASYNIDFRFDDDIADRQRR